MCCSSPFEKLRSSSEFLSRTVPFVSVWAMSIPQVKTPTFALTALLTEPAEFALRIQSTLEVLGPTFRRSTEYHSSNNATRAQSTTHDLDDSDVVNVEL